MVLGAIMDILLIAVIFIILLAIAALFALKRLQAKKSDLPKSPGLDKYLKVKKAKPVAPVTSEAITEALSHVQPKSEPVIQETVASPKATSHTDELSNIDTHIHNQNYDDAIGELKRLLMINPHHNEAMLKLLQVYGITKKYNTFNQLYEKIQTVADEKTVAEANFLKTLVDDEIAEQSSVAVKPEILPTHEGSFDTLDFTTGAASTNQTDVSATNTFDTNTVDSNKNVLHQDNQHSIDDEFDLVLDEPIILETPIDDKPVTNSQTPTEFDDLVLDFDVTAQVSQTTKAQAQSHPPKQTNDIGNIFDLSNPKKFDDTTDVKKEITEFELDESAPSISFDEQLDKSHQSPTSNTQTFASFDEASFDLNTSETLAHQQANKTTTSTVEDFDDLDFVLDFDKPKTPTQSSTLVTNQEDAFVFDDLDFTTKDNSQAKSQIDAPQQTPVATSTSDEVLSNEFDLQDFTLDSDLTPNKQADTQDNTTQDNELAIDDLSDSFDFSEFSLDFDTADSLNPKTQEVTFDTADFDVEPHFDDTIDIKESIDETPILVEDNEQTTSESTHRVFNIQITPAESTIDNDNLETPTVATTAPSANHPTTDLDFVNELDNTQVTLDLAQQYLQMGEYDSARRLLEEVTQTGNDQQRHFAQGLIARLG